MPVLEIIHMRMHGGRNVFSGIPTHLPFAPQKQQAEQAETCFP